MSNQSSLPKYARDYFSRVNPLQWSLLHFLEKTESTRPSDISKDKVHNAFYSSLRDILKVPTMKGDPVYHSRSEIASSNPQNKIAVKRFISQELLDAKDGINPARKYWDNRTVERTRTALNIAKSHFTLQKISAKTVDLLTDRKRKRGDDSASEGDEDEEEEEEVSSDERNSSVIEGEVTETAVENNMSVGEDDTHPPELTEFPADFKKSFVNIKEEDKWRLRSGRYVEDIMYENGVKLRQEALVHSWILDTSCPLVKTWFSDQEWQEICTTNSKDDPKIDKFVENLILRYDVKTVDALRAAVMKPWLQEEYNHQKHFDAESLHLAVTDILRLWESNSLLNQPSSLERWYDVNVWGPLIDRFFLDLDSVALVRGEGCSLASAARKNAQRTLETRQRLGSRGDGIFRSLITSEEYGSIECGKEVVPMATKTLQDRRKVGKLMKDMIKGRIQASNDSKMFAREIEAIGIVHCRLTADFYSLDLPAGSIARLIHHDHCFVPVDSMKMDGNHVINVGEVLALIVNVFKHKRRLERSMAITSDAIPTKPSNHLQRVLSGEMIPSSDDITESVAIPPTLSTPRKSRRKVYGQQN